MLRLAQASSSEYFSAWGVPPNQRRTPGKLDGELNIVPFYGGWEMVFRPKVEAAAEMIAWLAEGAVENGSYIGYSQNNGQYPREGVFDALFAMVNPDTRKIRRLVNCDCSSLAGACVYSSGAKDARLYNPMLRTMWTGTEEKLLMGTGAFVKLTDPLLLELGTGLRRGDILLKEGHTAIAIDSDDHLDTYPYKIQDCKSCNVRSGPGTEYKVLHTLNSGAIVQVVSTASNGWKKIVIPDGFGYVSGKYCKTPLPTATATGDVWLRSVPGIIKKETEIIVIPMGATVYLTGDTQGSWVKCIYATHTGWASKKYIKG